MERIGVFLGPLGATSFSILFVPDYRNKTFYACTKNAKIITEPS